jgi:hypothetical protein
MYWAKRQLRSFEYAAHEDLLLELQGSHPRDHEEFLMVGVASEPPDEPQYFVGVPFASLLQWFVGFEPVLEDQLPSAVDYLLVGDPTHATFLSRFKFRK